MGKFSDSWGAGCDPLPLDLVGVPLAEEDDWAGVTVVDVVVDTGVLLLLALDRSVAANVLLLVVYR